MTKPCIICVAITGSLPTKANNPAVPVTISEQIESTHEAFEAGAAIAHCHVRNDDQTPTSDPAKFALLVEGLKKHCPGHCQRKIIYFTMRNIGIFLPLISHDFFGSNQADPRHLK
jgi:uncharacterized protein (DUF849 family)